MFSFDGYDFYGVNKTEKLLSSLTQYKNSCDMMRSVPRYENYLKGILHLMYTKTIFRVKDKLIFYKYSFFLASESIQYTQINEKIVEIEYDEDLALYLALKYNLEYNDDLIYDTDVKVTRVCDRESNEE